MESWVNFTPILGVLGLGFALLIFVNVSRADAGTERMKEIAESIHAGAMAFLRREYTMLLVFVAVVGALLGWRLGFWKFGVKKKAIRPKH